MLPFTYASGDWMLSLDDDESMAESFDALVPELMRAPGVTHYFFPRKWVTGLDPSEYVHADPWFPNWAPRLFRNDRRLVWKPAKAHSMYRVQGPGYFEDRTSILHFEPVWCTPEERAAKVESYRQSGAAAPSERYYAIPADAPRRPVALRRETPAQCRASGALDPVVHRLSAAAIPPWGSSIVSVDIPASARAGTTILAEVSVRNTGTLAWSPTYAQRPAAPWPAIRLSYHLFSADGRLLDWDKGTRTDVVRFVAPGEAITMIVPFPVPVRAGAYAIEWDMLSEGECWFAECGGTVARSPLAVTA